MSEGSKMPLTQDEGGRRGPRTEPWVPPEGAEEECEVEDFSWMD